MRYEWPLIRRRGKTLKLCTVRAPRLLLPFEEAILAAGPKTRRHTPEQRKASQEAAAAWLKFDPNKGEVPGEILLEPLIWQAEPLYHESYAEENKPIKVIVHLMQCERGVMLTRDNAAQLLDYCYVRAASPRDVFSICADGPELYKELGSDPVGIIAPEEVLFDGVWRVPCVWLGSAVREVAFIPSRYPLNGTYWCAFCTYYMPA